MTEGSSNTDFNMENLPTTWEDYCSTVNKSKTYFLNQQGGITCSTEEKQLDPKTDRNLIVDLHTAEAFKALIQLVNLRKAWTMNWDVSKSYLFYSIYSDKTGSIQVSHFNNTSTILSFPSEEMALKFLACFRTLIMQARELL